MPWGNFFKCRKLCADRTQVECATTFIGFEWLVIDGAIRLLNNPGQINYSLDIDLM